MVESCRNDKEAWLLDPTVFKRTPSEEHAAFGAHIGLLGIIKDLAAARIQRKLLSLAIELQTSNAIILHAATEDVSAVSERIEILILRDSYYLFDSGAPNDLVMPITRTLFSSLHSLVIDHNGFQYWYKIEDIARCCSSGVSSGSIFESGQPLHMTNSRLYKNYMIQLLRCYGQRSRCFEVINSESQGHYHLNSILTSLKLEILSINEHHKQFRKSAPGAANTQGTLDSLIVEWDM
jgi:hypothetical protein